MTAEDSLTPTDVRLLARLVEEPNVVRAARSTGIPRDRAVYRLGRLARLFGRPVVRTRRGGADQGSTHLTSLGLRLLRRAEGARSGSNHWSGTFRAGPPPQLVFEGGDALEVAFHARDGTEVRAEVDPEAFVLALRPVDLSARNRLRAVVEEVRARRDGTATVVARWGTHRIRVAVTRGSVVRLGLAPGRRVYCYVKATAVRRLSTPRGASPRSS